MGELTKSWSNLVQFYTNLTNEISHKLHPLLLTFYSLTNKSYQKAISSNYTVAIHHFQWIITKIEITNNYVYRICVVYSYVSSNYLMPQIAGLATLNGLDPAADAVLIRRRQTELLENSNKAQQDIFRKLRQMKEMDKNDLDKLNGKKTFMRNRPGEIANEMESRVTNLLADKAD